MINLPQPYLEPSAQMPMLKAIKSKRKTNEPCYKDMNEGRVSSKKSNKEDLKPTSIPSKTSIALKRNQRNKQSEKDQSESNTGGSIRNCFPSHHH